MGRWFDKIVFLGRFLHLQTSSVLILAALIQMVTFVLLARNLGVAGFGLLMLLQAATQLALEFVSLGAGDAFIRRVARAPSDHGRALGHALLIVAATWPPVTACVVFFSWHYGHAAIGSTSLIIFISGELLGNRLAALTEHVCIAHSQVLKANYARLIPALSRMVLAATVIILYDVHEVSAWLAIQGCATVVVGLGVFLFLAVGRLGKPIISFSWEDLRFGFVSMCMHLASVIQFSADRLVLGAALTIADVAVYSTATRALQFGNLPVQGVLRNLFSGFFRAGAGGIVHARKFAYENFVRILTIGSLSGIGLFLIADLLPLILGKSYSPSVDILRWMSALPLLQGIQYLLADALTGSDNQGARLFISGAAAVIYLAIIAVMTYTLGLPGLVIGLYVFQLLSIAAYIVILERSAINTGQLD
jgi:O-antigen/teichoic acid export membrane protein